MCLLHVHLFFLIRQDGDKLIRLWIHEVYRVFYDRLIDDNDKETFFNIVKEKTTDFFKLSLEKVDILALYMLPKIIYKKLRQSFNSV